MHKCAALDPAFGCNDRNVANAIARREAAEE